MELEKLKSSLYSLKHCHPLSVFIHFDHVSKAPCSVYTHNAQRDESRQHKNKVKRVSPHDSLKSSLALQNQQMQAKKKNHQLQLRKDKNKNTRLG